MLKHTFRTFLLSLILITQTVNFTTQATNIIFDLGDVLFSTYQSMLVLNARISEMVSGIYNPLVIPEKFDAFLEKLVPANPLEKPLLHNGKALPQVMVDWLRGTLTSSEIRTLIIEFCDADTTFFDNAAEKAAIKELALVLFTPEFFVKATYPIKRGIELVKKCYRKVDNHGNRLNKLYLVTNMDREIFAQMKADARFDKIFAMFDGIVVSGEEGFIKPEKEIFELLFSRYNINADEELTFYIDDQKENIKAAHHLGKAKLFAMQCRDKNFRFIEKAMDQLGIF